MRRTIYAPVVLLIVSSAIVCAAGQATIPISVGVAAALPIPIGVTSVITVTVTNISNSTVQLTFLGLRWEWNNPTRWFIGGDSDKGAILAAGEIIAYHISVDVPSNVTEGTHQLSVYATYHWFTSGSWTATLSHLWVSNIPLVYSTTQSQSQIQTQMQSTTTTEHAGLLEQASVLEVIAALVLITGIGLFLERGSIRRIIAKSKKTTPEPSPNAESKKTPSEKQGEQEL